MGIISAGTFKKLTAKIGEASVVVTPPPPPPPPPPVVDDFASSLYGLFKFDGSIMDSSLVNHPVASISNVTFPSEGVAYFNQGSFNIPEEWWLFPNFNGRWGQGVATELASGTFTAEAVLKAETATFGRTIFYNGRGIQRYNNMCLFIRGNDLVFHNNFNYTTRELIMTDAMIGAYADYVHVAMVRSGTTARFYVNGVLKGTVNNFELTASANLGFGIGVAAQQDNPTQSLAFKGFMDVVRLTKAERYTANFTPPTAYPNPPAGPHPVWA